MIHSDFDLAFRPGVKFISETGEFNRAGEPVLAGWLTTASGKVVVCDPYDLAHFEFAALARTIPPGRYAVHLATSRLWMDGEETHHRVSTAAKLLISPAPVVNWELAKRSSEHETMVMLGWGDGYSMGGGFSCIAAADLVSGENRLRFAKAYFEWGKQHFLRTEYCAGEFNDPHHPSGNAVAFISGDHDGMAYVFWGLDAEGNIAQLAIDFCILIEPIEESVSVPLADVTGGKSQTVDLAGQKLTISLTADSQDASRISLEVRGDLWGLRSMGKSIVYPDGKVQSCSAIAFGEISDELHRETMTLDGETLRRGMVQLTAAVGMRRKQAVYSGMQIS